MAFNWSVMMSMGSLLFGNITVTILLSNLIGFYCVIAIYHIARLFVSPSNALLAGAIFYSAPVVTFHNYIDEKVDLALLYVSLCTVLLLLDYFRAIRVKKTEPNNTALVRDKTTLERKSCALCTSFLKHKTCLRR